MIDLFGRSTGPVCWGCDHAHTDGKEKPCACGCEGFVVSMKSFAREGCMNPDCGECRATGRHPPAPGTVS